ncbi:formyltetrahydrofolate deformylase [Peribacillus butanolivorans]|uniref:Formyltetrahydrofolate deformylase n=1 Tax=Peribacillus butanolivorans TaxID=421767 RepID=A0AAX0RZV8_9BACI|nr:MULTISPECIES: formyltetrahydrofolate deformylase [Peribacillus]KQU17431.1 formyltetrahydrofolate deformylase [Bacillus sp. Leaf13]KRF65296.1 formyltetrahydrofolate deformylase [Bacillus sp. Soil768D1]MBK5461103.1 formyltetrahydrofolate deformylase [Peribacillus sp. TH27]MBK5499245.1 formyltetrahydrofolate deformylase [Peribacillus sp. TH14]AXN38942.1 formyltetrahydrofolate deformylase [Peribacillus butanolivorans]
MSNFVQEQLQEFRVKNQDRGRLIIKCPDQPGIVATVTAFLKEHGANIVELSQYSMNPEGGTFFTRIEFDCPGLKEKALDMEVAFQEISTKFSMQWTFNYVSDLKRTAIFVSKEPHCLLELLWEWQSGDLLADIALVISNHEDTRQIVESMNIPFYYIPANKDIRKEVEAQQLKLLEEFNVDLIVLARYMQILTPDFVAAHPNKIINIHHSFLPAFIGARPYERAYNRGVKLIGATSHYVTNDLDEGPIIEQDIERVDHRDSAEDMKKVGRSAERRVLARAVKWHLEDRVLVHENKTVVF